MVEDIKKGSVPIFALGVLLGGFLAAFFFGFYTQPININCNTTTTNQQDTQTNQPTNFVPNNMNEFAQCLTNKNFTFYGAFWCPHCANEKIMFGSGFQYIHYVECDLGNSTYNIAYGNNTFNPTCAAAEVQGFPTFKVGENVIGVGETDLGTISKATGCV